MRLSPALTAVIIVSVVGLLACLAFLFLKP